MKLNATYGQLAPAFFFTELGARVAAYQADHPDKRLLRLGVGDVRGPLSPVVIEALRRAVGEQSKAATFHGYLPETGTDFLKAAVVSYYGRRGVALSPQEVFISSGAAEVASSIQDKTAFLPDYAFAGSDSAAGTSVSGLVGSAMVAAAAIGICALGGFFRKTYP